MAEIPKIVEIITLENDDKVIVHPVEIGEKCRDEDSITFVIKQKIELPGDER